MTLVEDDFAIIKINIYLTWQSPNMILIPLAKFGYSMYHNLSLPWGHGKNANRQQIKF
jgi:hypothetical protein